jgi:hypothetical protein
MIKLTDSSKLLVLICKGHFKDLFPENREGLVGHIKSYYNEYYTLDADEYLEDFRGCMFNRLLDLFELIANDDDVKNRGIREAFRASFEQSPSCSQETPMERTINSLIYSIRRTRVTNHDGTENFNLKLSPDFRLPEKNLA